MDNSRDFRKELFPFLFYGDEYNLRLDYTSYTNNGTLALSLMNHLGPGDEEAFAVATVNLPESSRLAVNEQFVDTNNLPGISEWLTCTGIASPTGESARSGYCEYPVFAFNLTEEQTRQLIDTREDAIAAATIRLIENSGLQPVERTPRGDRYHIAVGTDIVLYHGGTDAALGKGSDVFLLASSTKHPDRDMWRLRCLPSDVRKALAQDIQEAVMHSSRRSTLKLH